MSDTEGNGLKGFLVSRDYINKDPFKPRSEGFPGGSVVKNPPAMQESPVRSLGWGDPLKEKMATHSRILDWKIP